MAAASSGGWLEGRMKWCAEVIAAAHYVSTIPSLDPLAAESRLPCGSAR
jgi:hypothetical protein